MLQCSTEHKTITVQVGMVCKSEISLIQLIIVSGRTSNRFLNHLYIHRVKNSWLTNVCSPIRYVVDINISAYSICGTSDARAVFMPSL